MIDYKKLLVAYINHVIDCEGVSFLEDGFSKNLNLNEDEAIELLKIWNIIDSGGMP